MSARANPFHTLGLDLAAPPEKIRQAFVAISLKHHPDKLGSEGDSTAFIDARWAYEQLSDANLREVWKADYRHKARRPDGPYQAAFLHTRGAKEQDVVLKTTTETHTLRVSFAQAFTGVNKKETVRIRTPCPHCARPLFASAAAASRELASGCETCNNTHSVLVPKSISVFVPRGAYNGFSFRPPATDVKIVVECDAPDASMFGDFYVQRQHNHMFYTHRQTLAFEAARSITVMALTLPSGAELRLDVGGTLLSRMIPMSDKPWMYQCVLMLRGRGFPSVNPKFPHGNLYVVVPLTLYDGPCAGGATGGLRPEVLSYTPFEPPEEPQPSQEHGCAQQ
uniref:J domain-containing protein n=1 Tax=viral metagenome TaxID=1070528 RepID=A0A6C0KB33_9ZZZZ